MPEDIINLTSNIYEEFIINKIINEEKLNFEDSKINNIYDFLLYIILNKYISVKEDKRKMLEIWHPKKYMPFIFKN